MRKSICLVFWRKLRDNLMSGKYGDEVKRKGKCGDELMVKINEELN